jgi:hypothetical protein
MPKDPLIREKFTVAKLSKPQLNGLQATARGEVVRTYTGSIYTITGPVGSKALWGLMRMGLISDRPWVRRRPKMPMVLTASGRRVLDAPHDSRNVLGSPEDASCYGRPSRGQRMEHQRY